MKDIVYLLIIFCLILTLIFAKSCEPKPKEIVGFVEFDSLYTKEIRSLNDTISSLYEINDSLITVASKTKKSFRKNIVNILTRDTIFLQQDTACASLIKLASEEITKRDSVIYNDSIIIDNQTSQIKLYQKKDSLAHKALIKCDSSNSIIQNKLVKAYEEIDSVKYANKKLKKENWITRGLNVISFIIGKAL